MNAGRATLAIVRRQLDGAYGIDWAVRWAIALGIGALFAPLYDARVLLFAVAGLAPLAAASEDRQARTIRRISFFAMPLYGRQLARAHAVAPALTGLAVPLGLLAGYALRERDWSPTLTTVAVLANVVGALVALSAVFRDGPRAWLYYLLTFAAGNAIALPVFLRLPHALALATAIAVVLGFAALRAFGETLARYDPLPT